MTPLVGDDFKFYSKSGEVIILKNKSTISNCWVTKITIIIFHLQTLYNIARPTVTTIPHDVYFDDISMYILI